MINELHKKFTQLVNKHNLNNKEIEVSARPLSIREAIGETGRDNLPLQRGHEVLIQAELGGYAGQAFTDNPGDFKGTIKDLLHQDFDDNFNRALLIASINAVTCYLGLVDGTVHCKDEDLEKCGEDVAEYISKNHSQARNIGIIGFQPVIIENIVNNFGSESVMVTDLNEDKIGEEYHGVEIWDGSQKTEELIKNSDLVLATGSTVVNDSLDEITAKAKEHKKELLLFGTTIAGPAVLLGLNRICPRSY
ncbi:DUF364 domain-containing protein [Natranaerobius thermophilus JW/NM-WN-LF]|nr:DUF364 domain-containing protein [Natranaerobius thermophilus]